MTTIYLRPPITILRETSVCKINNPKASERKTKQIDEIDSKILKALLIESRISFTELSEMCGISVTAVIKRYSRLKETGIILGEHMYLNPVSIGYESIAEIGILTDLADREKVLELLKNEPAVTTVSSIGKYDIFGLVMARKSSELACVVQQIDKKPFVKNLDVLIFADLWDNPWHPENLIVNPSEQENQMPRPQRPHDKFEPIPLDDIDIDVAKALMKNSRVPFKNIAKQVKISTSNVIKRYHALREKGVLNLSSITVDLLKLGFKANIDSYIKVTNRGSLPEVEAQLLKIPNLTFCAKYVGGAYDLRIAVNAKNFNDYALLKNRIYSIPNIRHAEFDLFVNLRPWPVDFMCQSNYIWNSKTC
jgi:Lrp/AsnC family transcriptional regulator for asnA, asnC and gidA